MDYWVKFVDGYVTYWVKFVDGYVTYWVKFADGYVTYWVNHRRRIRDWRGGMDGPSGPAPARAVRLPPQGAPVAPIVEPAVEGQ